MRPEAELLLCCARTYLDPGTVEQIRSLLRHDIEWMYLLRIAALHGVMPLLYWHLNTTWPKAVPPETLDLLRDYFHANELHNRLLTQELLTLLQLLESHGIAAIPYKGPALAATVYGNLAFRQFSDLDILVHKGDVLRAKALLISQGYRLPIHLTEAQEVAYLRSQCDYHLVREGGVGSVELHWGITRRHFPFPLDLERVWERVEPVSLAGTTICHLPPEELLLILCVHGAKHGWPQLKWICDVAELIRRDEAMDWGQVMEQAGRLRSERILFLGLCLAYDLLGATLPEGVVQQVRANLHVRLLVAQVRDHLFREADSLGELFQRDCFPAKTLECRRDRWRYCVHVMRERMTPNVRDRALLPLPPALTGLYYLLRPFRLLREYGLRRSTQHRPV